MGGNKTYSYCHLLPHRYVLVLYPKPKESQPKRCPFVPETLGAFDRMFRALVIVVRGMYPRCMGYMSSMYRASTYDVCRKHLRYMMQALTIYDASTYDIWRKHLRYMTQALTIYDASTYDIWCKYLRYMTQVLTIFRRRKAVPRVAAWWSLPYGNDRHR